MREEVDATLRREAEHEWQKIHWQTDPAVALKLAQQQNKPIFVMFVVDEKAVLAKTKGQT